MISYFVTYRIAWKKFWSQYPRGVMDWIAFIGLAVVLLEMDLIFLIIVIDSIYRWTK